VTDATGTLLQVAVPVPLRRIFDYLPPLEGGAPALGSRVVVPFGTRRQIGLVVGHASKASVASARIRRVDQVLDNGLVDPELLALLHWAAGYYAATPGEIVNHALPAPLRRIRPQPDVRTDWVRLNDGIEPAALADAPRQRDIARLLADGPRRRSELVASGGKPDALRRMLDNGRIVRCEPERPNPVPGPSLNKDQRRALAAILRARRKFEALLLAGVTGSGKTEVYLQAARRVLQHDRQVLILVPEIGLTPQFVRRIESRLAEYAAVYHSGLADGERIESWRAAADGSARLVIGTRSAVFLPMAKPGLIIVDEEHDASFKQFDGMRYHARDVAVMRASRLGIPIVLGSATPSLESLSNARRNRYRMLELPRRVGDGKLPRWCVDDPRGQALENGLTATSIDAIGTALDAGEQVLVYRNRRGFAPVLLCNECGWQADCSHCSAHLTLHRSTRRLICHHCGRSQRVPARCPGCGSPQLDPVGAGTERIEAALQALFPETPVLRADRDAVRGRDEFEQLLTRAAAGDPCILVGTQMLAKGHHLPGIGLSIMLDADQLLFSADFRAGERLAQSIVQVSGRAGRGRPGIFMLQTRHPEHPLFETLSRGRYLDAAGEMLDERRDADLPPFRPLAMIRAEAVSAGQAADFLRRVRTLIRAQSIQVAGPLEAILQRRAGYWRYQLWLLADSRSVLTREIAGLAEAIEQLKEARSVRWHIDVDPLEL